MQTPHYKPKLNPFIAESQKTGVLEVLEAIWSAASATVVKFRTAGRSSQRGGRGVARDGLETVDLDAVGLQAETLIPVGEELLDILALITLKLNHLAHLVVVDDGAITSEFLLDHLENLLLIVFLGDALDRGQSLTTITLYAKG